MNTLEGGPVQQGKDYTDYTDEKTREEEVNGSSFTRINNQRITMHLAMRAGFQMKRLLFTMAQIFHGRRNGRNLLRLSGKIENQWAVVEMGWKRTG